MPDAPELTARPKFSCPSCGAEARWDPAKQALVCPYCGTVAPGELASDGSTVVEHDLVAALRNLGDEQRGWQSERVSVKCQSCQAISVFEPGRVAQRCEFCGSAQLVPYEQTKAPIRPESLLPFKLSEPQVRETVRAWYAGRWFAPSRLKSGARTDTVHGVYIPYWTFDAQVSADWTADAGYHYYETEHYRDANGREQTRQVQRTRWVPAAGHMDQFFDDALVPASLGINETLLRKIEPFPTNELVPYDPGYLAGWVVEQYHLDLIAAAQRSRAQMEREIERMCASEVPGDTHRNLQVAADFSAQTFKHIIVPVWLLTYNYGARRFQVVVNGYTGSIAGKYPLSWLKIALLVLVTAVIVAVAIAMQSHS